MKKIYLLFLWLICFYSIPITAKIGNSSITFTSKKAVNDAVKFIIKTGENTKLNETFTVTGAAKVEHEQGEYRIYIKEDGKPITINGDVTSLDCKSSVISHLDLSHATSLKKLICSNNNITALNLLKCPNLEDLNCSYNYYITTVDLSDCSKLKSVVVNDCNLKNLYLPNNPEKIELLDYSNNKSISDIDVSKCKALNTLKCYDCGMNLLMVENLVSKIPACTTLSGKLYARTKDEDNFFTKSMIKTLSERGWTLYDSDGDLFEGIDDFGNINFKSDISANFIFNSDPVPHMDFDVFLSKGSSYIDIRNYTGKLIYYPEGDNFIKTNKQIISLEGENDQKEILNMDFSNYPYLKSFKAIDMGFKDLILTKNIESLTLKHCAYLESLSLPISDKLNNLSILNCSKLSANIDLSEFKNLKVVDIENSNIKELKIPAVIQSLNCINLRIKSLDLSKCSELQLLDISYTKHCKVVLPQNGKLDEIAAFYNAYTEEEMTELISALPKTKNGILAAANSDTSFDSNQCTTIHVRDAAAKGWTIVDTNGNPIKGKTPTSIKLIFNTTDDKTPYYDLQGRCIEQPVHSGIYIHNGKKVIIR